MAATAFIMTFPGPPGPPNLLLLAGGSSLTLGFPYPQPRFLGQNKRAWALLGLRRGSELLGAENRLEQENLNVALPFPNP